MFVISIESAVALLKSKFLGKIIRVQYSKIAQPSCLKNNLIESFKDYLKSAFSKDYKVVMAS